MRAVTKPPPVPNPLTPDGLKAIGFYLYDEPTRWQSLLAADLLVSPQCVRHWSGGVRSIPGPAIAALRLMVIYKRDCENLLT